MTEPHDCLDHLHLRSYEWTEEHGERCYEEWWECGVCRQKFTDREVKQRVEAENA